MKEEKMTPQQREFKKLIDKNYSSNDPNYFGALLNCFLIGIIVIGGFTKNWALITSGVLLVLLIN